MLILHVRKGLVMVANFTGLDVVLKQFQSIKDEVEKGDILQEALVPMGIMIRDEAKRIAHRAPAAYRVHVPSSGERRKKGKGEYIEYQPGTVADAIIIKKLQKGELKGLPAALIVTLRGEPKKFGNLLEYGSRNKTGAPMPFMRTAFDSKIAEAEQLGQEKLKAAVERKWK
jgi:hypothetical protein